MFRDYSSEKLIELQNFVNLDMNFWSFLGDMISDLLLYLKKISGFSDISSAEDVSAYHREVIDMHNYTNSELIDIFNEVNGLDMTFGNRIATSVFEPLDVLSKTLKMFSDQINPQSGGFTVAGINIIAEKAKALADPVWEKTNAALDASLSEEAKRLMAEGGKQALKSGLSFIIHCASFLGSGDGFYVWDMLDDFTEFGYALATELYVGGGWLGAKILKDDQTSRKFYSETLNEAENYLEIDSMLEDLSVRLEDSGWQKGSEWVKTLDDGSRVIRTSIKMYNSLSKGLDGLFGEGSKVNPNAFEEPTPIKKVETFKKTIEGVEKAVKAIDSFTDERQRGVMSYLIDESKIGKFPKQIGKLKGEIQSLIEDGFRLAGIPQ